MTYAAADVTWLRMCLSAVACPAARRKARLSWVAEEMAILSNPNTYRADPAFAWERLKIRGGNRRFLALVRALAAWREQEAQRINIPRQRLLKDETLMEIAAIAPSEPGSLVARPRHHPRLRRGPHRFVVAGGRGGDGRVARGQLAAACPDSARPSRPSAALVALLKVLLAARCEENEVAPKLIASSDDIDRIASEDEPDVPALHGWRRTVFGADAIALREGRVALGVDGKRIQADPGRLKPRDRVSRGLVSIRRRGARSCCG